MTDGLGTPMQASTQSKEAVAHPSLVPYQGSYHYDTTTITAAIPPPPSSLNSFFCSFLVLLGLGLVTVQRVQVFQLTSAQPTAY